MGNIQEDQAVSVMHNKLWHKGLVIGVSRLIGAAEIFLKDTGPKNTCPSMNCMNLTMSSKNYRQAIACALAYTGSEPPTSI